MTSQTPNGAAIEPDLPPLPDILQAQLSHEGLSAAREWLLSDRASRSVAEDREGFVLVPREMVAFLNGEAAIDGVWYGERHPEHKGLLWWRKALMAAAAPTPTASIAPKAEGEAVAEVNNIGMLKATPHGTRTLKAGDKLYAAPVAQAAAGAWQPQMRELITKLRSGDWSLRSPDELACMVADMLERAIPRIADALSPRPEADADRASGIRARTQPQENQA